MLMMEYDKLDIYSVAFLCVSLTYIDVAMSSCQVPTFHIGYVAVMSK